MLFPDACPPMFRFSDPNVLQVEMQMFGIISSAMAYGAVVLLFADCCNRLLKTRHISSRQTRIQLFMFALTMMLLSTGALVQGILYLLFQSGMFGLTPTAAMLSAPGQRVLAVHLIDLGIPLALPFLVLGANYFMVCGPSRNFEYHSLNVNLISVLVMALHSALPKHFQKHSFNTRVSSLFPFYHIPGCVFSGQMADA